MRIGWLQDDPGYVGGAEMTANELRAGAPDGVEIVDCPPGGVVPGLDRYVVHNCMFYAPAEAPRLNVWRFIHDHRGPGPIDSPNRIFYSPLHRKRVGLDGELVPAPIDRAWLTPPAGGDRKGAVHIGTFGHPGKGQQLLREWAAEHGEVAVYGHGPFVPAGPNIDYRGPVAPADVPAVLWQHDRFVHLPTEVEAFGRGVAEAWAAGCELTVNRNVGALHWLENEPDALDTATDRFWELIANG